MAVTEAVELLTGLTNPDITPPGVTSTPDAIELANDSFVVVGTSGGVTDGEIFDANGAHVAAITNIAGTEASVAALSNGNLVVAGQGAVGTIDVTLVNSVTGAVGTFLTVTGGDHADVAALNTGFYAIAYQADFGGGDTDIMVDVRSNAGVDQGAFDVDTSTTVADSDVSVAGLSNGDIAVAFTRQAVGGGDTAVYYAVFHSNGGIVKAPTLAYASPNSLQHVFENASIVATPDGFAIAYETTAELRVQTDTQGPPFLHDIFVSRFGLAGNATSSGFDPVTHVTFTSDGISDNVTDTDPSLAVSPDGNLVLSYTETNQTDGTSQAHVASIRGTQVLADTVAGDGQHSAAVAFGAGQIGVFEENGGSVHGQHLYGSRDMAGDQVSDLNETLNGDDFADLINGLGGDDIINGGRGNDNLEGATGNDIIHGGQGDDLIAGNGNSNDGEGGAPENDTLFGDDGNDTIFGEGGDDTITGGRGNDTMDGGDGPNDTASYADATGTGVTVSLALQTGQTQTVGGGLGSDKLSNFENLTGSAFSDHLTGDANSNVLDGGTGGNDTLDGGGGNDTFKFTVANLTSADTVTGGTDYDTIVFSTAGTIDQSAFTHVTGIEEIDLANGTNNVTLTNALALSAATFGSTLLVRGGNGNDRIDASLISSSVVDIVAGAGNDLVFGASPGGKVSVYITASDLTNADSVQGQGGQTSLVIETPGTIAASVFQSMSGLSEVDLFGGATSTLTVTDALVATAPGSSLIVASSAGSDIIDVTQVTTAANGWRLEGGNGADTFKMTAAGLIGANRSVDGGDDTSLDTIAFTTAGTVAASAFANVTHVERLALANGTNNIALANPLVGSADDNHVFYVVGGTGSDTVNAAAVTTAANRVFFTAGAGNDTLTGGFGADTFYFAAADLTASDTVNGLGGTPVDRIVFTTAGTIAAAAFQHVTHVEQLVLANGTNNVTLANAMVAASDDGHILSIVGGTGNDSVNASALTSLDRAYITAGSGSDTLTGGAGLDIFYFAAADLTSADTVNGGAGASVDVLSLTTAGTVAAAAFQNVSHVEEVVLANGTNNVTLTDALVSSADDGHVLYAIGGTGNDAINASAVTATNRIYFVTGSGNDTLTGGLGADDFFFAATDLTAGDTVNGGASTSVDSILFTTTGTIAASAFTNVSHIEQIYLAATGASSVTLSNALVTSADDNHILHVTGGTGADTINAAAVTTATNRVVFIGGGGADVLTAGAGADFFAYLSASDSTSTGYDTVTGFSFTADRFDIPGGAGTITAVEAARNGALDSGANFDTELAARFSTLGAHHAGLLTATSGTLSGQIFLVVDLNGTAGYQSGADLVIHLATATGTLVAGDFV